MNRPPIWPSARRARRWTRRRLEPNDIDVIIVATSTPDFTMPSTACLVQGRLGASKALAFDIVNACAGFVYAFDAATRYLQGGDLQNALVIGVDRGSRLVESARSHAPACSSAMAPARRSSAAAAPAACWLRNCIRRARANRSPCRSAAR